MFNKIWAALGSFFSSDLKSAVVASIAGILLVGGLIWTAYDYNESVKPTPTQQAHAVLDLICDECLPDANSCKSDMAAVNGTVSSVNEKEYNLCLFEITAAKCETGIPASCYEAFNN